jgi:hypothetical protein
LPVTHLNLVRIDIISLLALIGSLRFTFNMDPNARAIRCAREPVIQVGVCSPVRYFVVNKQEWSGAADLNGAIPASCAWPD